MNTRIAAGVILPAVVFVVLSVRLATATTATATEPGAAGATSMAPVETLVLRIDGFMKSASGTI